MVGMNILSVFVVAFVYNAGGLFHASRKNADLDSLYYRREAYMALDFLREALREVVEVDVAGGLDVEPRPSMD